MKLPIILTLLVDLSLVDLMVMLDLQVEKLLLTHMEAREHTVEEHLAEKIQAKLIEAQLMPQDT